MTNIYEQLKPAIKEQLNESSEKYNSVSQIKYTLMSKTMWSDLKISTIKDLILFTNINKSDLGINSMLYGTNILNNDDE
tara:strand:- start:30 stop:266 length:237 start_codon:yes stop_codon:yes gene_type:complete